MTIYTHGCLILTYNMVQNYNLFAQYVYRTHHIFAKIVFFFQIHQGSMKHHVFEKIPIFSLFNLTLQK